MPPPTMGTAQTLIIGGTSAVIGQTMSAPLDRIKLLVQCQNEIMKSGRLEKPYKGVLNCIVTTYRNEGLLQFWRGYVAGVLVSFSHQALSFVFKEKLKGFMKPSQNDGHAIVLGKNVLAGGSAGALTLAVVYSLSYCRTRLANDVRVVGKGDERQFKGIVDVYRKTLHTDGIRGLYRGFVVSCVGIVVYRGCYFGFYDTLRPVFIGDSGNLFSAYLLGFAVTLSAGLVSYPFDTVRCRMMMRSCEEVKYRGSIDCAVQIIRNEGFISLMKGVSVNIFRGIAGAVMLPSFDVLKRYFTK